MLNEPIISPEMNPERVLKENMLIFLQKFRNILIAP